MDLRRLSRGPAMLCQALGIDRSFDTVDLLDIEAHHDRQSPIGRTRLA